MELKNKCTAHDHGNCELCDQIEAEVESLRQQLAAKDAAICGMREAIAKALSSSATCPHQEEVEYQKKRVSELEEPMQCGHYGANLQPDDSNVDVCMVCLQDKDFEAQLASLREVARAAKNQRQWQTISEAFDEALSSHESRWPVPKEG